MNRGYTLLWRKIWANPLLAEPGRKFTRLQAWLYIVNALASGISDESKGIKRGEFAASSRYLAQKWNWPRSTVQRFLRELEEAEMILRIKDWASTESIANSGLGHCSGHSVGQQESHFIICNYETYNPIRAVA